MLNYDWELTDSRMKRNNKRVKENACNNRNKIKKEGEYDGRIL
jgi:hypothetical protein